MATLHTTVEYTRKILIGSGVLIGSIFLIIGLFRLSIFLKEVIAPTPPPAPKAAFGKLQRIIFPPSVTQEQLTYTIDTVSGSFPELPDRINVYKIINDTEPNLFDLERARSRVANVDFESPERKISDTVYEWNQPDLNKRIVYDTLTRNFIYTTDYFNYEPVLTATRFLELEEAEKEAKRFLGKLESFPEDIDTTKTKTQLLSILGNELIPATSIATANIVRIDYFQKDVNELPIYYPSANKSTMNILISNYLFEPLEINFTHQNISEENTDYYIKSANEAFEELQNNKGYIATHFSEQPNIKIRNVFLAYYIGEKRQDHLMPIIVFTDNEGFYAYVSAVKNEFIK